MDDESFEQNFSWSEWTFIAPTDTPAFDSKSTDESRRVVEGPDGDRKWTA